MTVRPSRRWVRSGRTLAHHGSETICRCALYFSTRADRQEWEARRCALWCMHRALVLGYVKLCMALDGLGWIWAFGTK